MATLKQYLGENQVEGRDLSVESKASPGKTYRGPITGNFTWTGKWESYEIISLALQWEASHEGSGPWQPIDYEEEAPRYWFDVGQEVTVAPDGAITITDIGGLICHILPAGDNLQL